SARSAARGAQAPVRLEAVPAKAPGSGPTRARAPKMQLEFQLLALATLALVAFGLVMVFSSTSATATLGGGSASAFLVRQAVYALAGLGAMIALTRFDYRKLRPLAPSLLMASLGLCLAVFAVGSQVNGARRWISFGPIGLQPSELVKLALALWIPARLIRRSRPQTMGELAKPVGLMVVIACGMIAAEPDLGTVTSILVMVAAALLVSGVSLGLIARAYALVGALGMIFIMSEPYQRARLTAFLHPMASSQDSGYQGMQSLIGLGSGGVFGRGLGQGVQKIHFLPEAHTDMIASVVGEELGLIGIALLIAFYAVFVWAGLRIALACRDPFGKTVAASLTALISGQAAINLAAVFGLVPLTGITLPFVSYGGSSLVVSLMAVGILLNIAVNHGKTATTEVPDRRRRNGRTSHARARRR
ncbi:MAG: putative lipid II flippase FtsW, partial [Gaiellaceae bacterium]